MSTPLPNPPARDSDPWFTERNAFDLAIKQRLDVDLSDENLEDTYAHLEGAVLVIGGVPVGGSGGTVPDATSAVKGILQLAGDLEGNAGAPTVKAASTTVAGKVELATAAETTTGTDSARAVTPAGLKVELDKKAPLASPTFTGDPKAPTAAPGDNDVTIATTAFVQARATAAETNAVATAIAAIMAQIDQSVTVVTGSEPRPETTGRVFWIKGATEPVEMGEADVWLAEVPPVTNPPVITTSSLNSMVVGTPFSQAIEATGSPTSFAATGLPAGVTINTTTGVLSGTPTTAGSGSATVTATNAEGSTPKSLPWTVAATLVAPNISTATLPALTQGAAMTPTVLTNTGGPVASHTIPTGTVPAGMTVAVVSNQVRVTGTPTGSGAYSFTVRANNAAGSGDKAFSGTIAEAGAANLSIYGPATPGTEQLLNSDGGGSLRVGNRFYSTAPISVMGLRLFNPAAGDSTFLNTDVTAYAYLQSWTGTTVNAPVWASPVQSKVHTATRVSGEWTDILFDTPIALPGVNAASGTEDLLTLAVTFAGGQYYVFINPQPNNVDSVDGPAGLFMLAENANIGRAVNTLVPEPSNALYGVDILVAP